MAKRKSLWQLAWRLFLRDWRKRDLLTLLLSMVIATASGAVIFLVINQMQQATLSQAADALGGDLVVNGPHPLEPEAIEKSSRLGLRHTLVTEFGSVIAANGKIQLSTVKAIDDNYPLAGRIDIAKEAWGKAQSVKGAPAEGHIWLAPRTISKLNLAHNDPVELGYTQLRLAGSIELEPSQGSTLFTVAPSAIFNVKDLSATKIIQPGSRVSYRHLFAGAKEQIAIFKRWLKPKLDTSQRMLSVDDESPVAGSAISRAQSYFGLSGLLTLLLLAVAITLATNRYLSRQYDLTALMRCFGLSATAVTGLFVRILLILAILSSLLGLGAGSLFHLLLNQSLTAFLSNQLHTADYSVLVWPCLSAWLLLFGISVPALFRLKNVPPMRVLRGELGELKGLSWLIWLTTLAALVLVMWLQIRDWDLLYRVVIGLTLVCLFFSLISWVLLRFVAKTVKTKSAVINFSLRQLQYRRGLSILHLLAFSVTVFVMLLVVLVRVELIEKWQKNLGSGVPNHFLVNLSADEQTRLAGFLAENGVASEKIYPMVRGRISQIKGVPVKQWIEQHQVNHNALRRELNLSWSADLPKGNQVVAGQWRWPQTPVQQRDQRAVQEQTADSQHSHTGMATGEETALISIEERTATALGLKPGDSLTFSIGGENWPAKIQSIRKIDWQTFTPNFYVLAQPGSLDAFDATLITSFYLTPEQKQLLPQLVERFPGVSLIELDAIFAEIKKIIDKVSQAVELIMLFVLAAGVALIWAAMSWTLSQKRKQAAILRTLGAKKGFIQAVFRFEYVWLALLAAGMALLTTELITSLIYQKLFAIEYGWHWQWWLAVPPALLLFMLASSMRSVNRLSATPPMAIIRGEQS